MMRKNQFYLIAILVAGILFWVGLQPCFADNTQVVQLLNDLIQVDMDAHQAYGEALAGIKNDAVLKEKFEKFREQHKERISVLSDEVKLLKGQPPEFTPDPKGYMMKFYTQVRGLTGVPGVLSAMDTNEKMAHRRYEKALENKQLSNHIKDLLTAYLEQEKEHVHYIEQALKTHRS